MFWETQNFVCVLNRVLERPATTLISYDNITDSWDSFDQQECVAVMQLSNSP